jgi:hypothetical protein
MLVQMLEPLLIPWQRLFIVVGTVSQTSKGIR